MNTAVPFYDEKGRNVTGTKVRDESNKGFSQGR